MKVRTVVISVVVSVSLAAGAGYGAYYAMKGQESPVEVVPVMNINNSYWDDSSVYGTVTSQVAQTVSLDEEYAVEKIYVESGDTVKAGDPLFSYDMTLQELELEMEKLTLQTSELEMVKLEKDLEKLKNTKASASLILSEAVRRSSGEEGEEPELILEEPAEDAQKGGDPDSAASKEEEAGEPKDARQEDGDAQEGTLSLEGVEEVEGVPSSVAEEREGKEKQKQEDKEEQQRLAVVSAVSSYEELIAALDVLFQSYGDKLSSGDVGPALEEAVAYYRESLAEERRTQEDGGTEEIRSYILKDRVRQALGEEAAGELESYAEKMDRYHLAYAELLIAELDPENPGDLKEDSAKARKVYDSLTTAMQQKVQNLAKLEAMEELGKGQTAEGLELAAQAEDSALSGEPSQEDQIAVLTDGEIPQDTDNPSGEAQTPDASAEGNEDAPQPGDGSGGDSSSAEATPPTQDGTAGEEFQDGESEAESGGSLEEAQPAKPQTETVAPEEETLPAEIQTETVMPGEEILPVEPQTETAAAEEEIPPAKPQTETAAAEEEIPPAETETETVMPGEETLPVEPQTESPSESGAGTETETEPETDTGTETETEPETDTGTETETEPETETETETETENRYLVTVTGGYLEVADQNLESESFPAGALVTAAAQEDEMVSFEEWTWTVSEGELEIEDPGSSRITFTMPEADVSLTAQFRSNDARIQDCIDAFRSLAEKALGVEGVLLEGYDAEALETAIRFYQMNLAQQRAEIADGTQARLEDYELRPEVTEYLISLGEEQEAGSLAARYKELCFTLVRTLVDGLDPQNLTREAYERARNAYENLGDAWKQELDDSVYDALGTGETEAPPDGAMSRNGQTAVVPTEEPEEEPQETEDWEGEAPEEETEAETEDRLAEEPRALTYGEKLDAYAVILMIQELDLTQPETLLVEELIQVRDAYLALDTAQQALVWNSDALIELLRQYGLWTEPESEDNGEDDGPDWDDYGGYDDFDDYGYTAEELKEMIEELEQEIKDKNLEIRECELSVKQKQRVVDRKVVKSTLDGTVISIGTPDGNSDYDYFVKVANETGLYVKGVMNELSFSTLKVGDTISGTMSDSGIAFTAVITEISEYPDPNGANAYGWGWSSENSNASYYPFYALLDDPEGIEEGEAELKLTESEVDESDKIYLEKAMVRTGSDGKSYVYMRGEDGKLKKQTVTLGKTIYSYAVEITSGLSMEDEIAFPYGKNVHEGAATKQVDMLEDAYM